MKLGVIGQGFVGGSVYEGAFPESTFAMINKKRIKPNEIHSMELVGDVFGRIMIGIMISPYVNQMIKN